MFGSSNLLSFDCSIRYLPSKNLSILIWYFSKILSKINSKLLGIDIKLTSKLKQLHGEPHFFNIKGRGVNVWFIQEFETQDQPHDLPDFNDNLLWRFLLKKFLKEIILI